MRSSSLAVVALSFHSVAASDFDGKDSLSLLQTRAAVHTEDFVCDLCAESDNEFDPTGKKGKCERINERGQKSEKRCEKRKNRPGVIKGCCPDPPVECPVCPDGKEFKADNLDGKCAKFATRATKNQEVCDKIKGKKTVQEKCCEESLGYIQTKGVSCGWLGACGGDKNQAYINNGARQLSASASDVSSCEKLCDEHDECDGFCLVGAICYFRKDTECNDMPPTVGRSCWQKPTVEGRQCSSGQFQGGEACQEKEKAAAKKYELGECMPHKGINGGTNCGFREPKFGGPTPYTSACTRLMICEDKPGCIAMGITSFETCMAKVAEEDNCEKDFFEWRPSLGSHCFCNPKGRTWVPFTGFAPCVTCPMK